MINHLSDTHTHTHTFIALLKVSFSKTTQYRERIIIECFQKNLFSSFFFFFFGLLDRKQSFLVLYRKTIDENNFFFHLVNCMWKFPLISHHRVNINTFSIAYSFITKSYMHQRIESMKIFKSSIRTDLKGIRNESMNGNEWIDDVNLIVLSANHFRSFVFYKERNKRKWINLRMCKYFIKFEKWWNFFFSLSLKISIKMKRLEIIIWFWK